MGLKVFAYFETMLEKDRQIGIKIKKGRDVEGHKVEYSAFVKI